MLSLVHYETLHILSSSRAKLTLSDWAGTPNHRCASYGESPSHPSQVYELRSCYRLKAGPHCFRAKGGYTLRLRSPDDKSGPRAEWHSTILSGQVYSYSESQRAYRHYRVFKKKGAAPIYALIIVIIIIEIWFLILDFHGTGFRSKEFR